MVRLDAPGQRGWPDLGDRHRRTSLGGDRRRESDGYDSTDRQGADPDADPPGEHAPGEDGTIHESEHGESQRRDGELSQ